MQQSDQSTSWDSNKEKLPDSLVKTSSFSPFSATSLKSPDNEPVAYALISYCQRHNMIIASYLDYTLKFYDATTLFPLENRKTQKLDGFVTQMPYSHEADIYLLGCDSGSIYTYNASTDELQMLRQCPASITALIFLDYPFYAFKWYAFDFCIGTLENRNVYKFDLEKNYCVSLSHSRKSNLLVVGLSNGSVRIYHVKSLQMLCSSQAHKKENFGFKIENMRINGKEFVITTSRDCTIKIWHFRKGRMRLLRVIHTEEIVESLIVLENYKMVAVVCDGQNDIGFLKLFSGSVQRTFGLGKRPISNLFLMKDKNMIGGVGGIPGESCDSIEFVQLHPNEK